MKRTKVHKYSQWTDEYTGVWIDVFVIDSMPNNIDKMRVLLRNCFKACVGHVKFSTEISLKNNLKNFKRKLLYSHLDRRVLINSYLDEVSKIVWNSTSEVCNLCSPYHSDIHKKNLFDKYIRVQFEDKELSIIASYDEYLRNIYGNYMQLPPIEKRVRGHVSHTYLWV